MPFFASRRLSPVAIALSMICIAPHSFAAGTSTTIKLQTSPGNYCVATTNDSNGVYLDPAGSTAMLVDGVSLAEAPGNAANSHACQPIGGGSSDFQLSNIVISQDAAGAITNFTPAINTPFYVNWSVATNAATCVRTGSTNITAASITGWTLGSTVSSPSGTHHDAVTPKQGGSYTFGVACTNASGSKTGVAPNVPAAAPAPAPVLTATPSTAAVGGNFTISWPSMTNAASCIGTATKNTDTTPLVLANWTSAFDPAAAQYARTLTVPSGFVAGDKLNLSLTCSNSDSSASVSSASPAIVTVSTATPTAVVLALSANTATTGSPPSPATITVTATNAALAGASCTGTLVNGSTTITSGWTGWTPSFTVPASGALSQSVTIPNTVVAGSYTFKMSCSSGATDDSTRPATLVVSNAAATTCSATIPANDPRLAGVTDKAARVRLNTADIQYNAVPQGARTGVSFTEYANLWGFSDATTAPPPVAWPGIGGSSPGFLMARNGYFGAHFKTPAATSPPSQTSSYFTYTTYGSTDPISVSITPTCGDFSGDPSVNACYANNVASNDGKSMNWIYDSTGSQGVSKYFCYLKPNTDYYLNMMFTTTTKQADSKCTAADTTGSCRIRYTRR